MQTFYIVHTDKVGVLDYYRAFKNGGLLRNTPLEAWRAMVSWAHESPHDVDTTDLRLFRITITPPKSEVRSCVWTDEKIPLTGLMGVSFDAMPIGVNPPPHGTPWDIGMETLEEAMEPNDESDSWVPFVVITREVMKPELIHIEEVKS